MIFYNKLNYIDININGSTQEKERHAWAVNGKMIVDFASCRIISGKEYGWYK